MVLNGTDIQSADSKAGGARIKFYIAREKKKSKKKETMTVQSARRKEMGYELSRSVYGRRYDTGKRQNDEREKVTQKSAGIMMK